MSAVGDTNPAAIPDPKDIEISGEEAPSASDEIVESKSADESIPTVRILFSFTAKVSMAGALELGHLESGIYPANPTQ